MIQIAHVLRVVVLRYWVMRFVEGVAVRLMRLSGGTPSLMNRKGKLTGD